MKSLVFISFLLFSTNAYPWGKIGHRVVGHIAERHLEKSVHKKIKKILGNETLSKVSNWPDFMRSNREFRKYSYWHFVSIPDGKTYFDVPRNKKGDILMAMIHLEDTLRNKKSTKEEKVFALKYLVHLVGDIHQPLHAGRKEDRGGNSMKLKWFGKDSNLHKVWDENLIHLQKLSFTEYTDYIHFPTKAQIKDWKNSYYMDWIKESQALRAQVYNFDATKNYWEWDYNYANIKTLERRMLMAGVRLGHLLNDIFKNRPFSSKAAALRKRLKEIQ